MITRFGQNLFGTVDQFAKRERECWKFWESQPQEKREALVRTIQNELERLLASVENWLPGAAKEVSGGTLDIIIRIYPEEAVELDILTSEERLMASRVVEGLEELVDGLSDD